MKNIEECREKMINRVRDCLIKNYGKSESDAMQLIHNSSLYSMLMKNDSDAYYWMPANWAKFIYEKNI